MKIIIIGPVFPWRGGIAHYISLLSKHLSMTHSVEAVTFERQYPKMFFPGATQEEIGDHPAGPPARRLIDSINPWNWIAVGRNLRREKPDLIIFKYWLPFFGPCFGTIAKFAKRGTHTRVLFICDNIIPHERRPGDILFTRYAFRQADFFIVQSETVEKELNLRFPRAVYRTVPHPVYENFGDVLPKHDARTGLGIRAQKVILYFGYVRAYKGLLVLIEAMKRLRDEGHADILLLAVGEFYDGEEKYRRRVAELELESLVQFVSRYVPNNEVHRYFSAADLVVLPYLSATQSGIVQIAYNFDTPVIATDVGGLSEVVVDGTTGYVVPSNNPAALAHAIVRFYDEGKEEEFIANVRQEKRKYSWERLVEAIDELMSGSRDNS